jgi:hypothetical protein
MVGRAVDQSISPLRQRSNSTDEGLIGRLAAAGPLA